LIIGKKTPPALADRQSVGQPQCTLAQPFDEVGGDPIAQASLDEAAGEEEEMTMSQMTSLVKAEKTQEKDMVLVTMEVVRLRKAQAPTGRGLRTRPTMVGW